MKDIDIDSDGGLVSDDEQADKMAGFSCGVSTNGRCGKEWTAFLSGYERQYYPTYQEIGLSRRCSLCQVQKLGSCNVEQEFTPTLLYLEYDEEVLLDKAYACARDSHV